MRNPRVLTRVKLGLGYGLDILTLLKTRTPAGVGGYPTGIWRVSGDYHPYIETADITHARTQAKNSGGGVTTNQPVGKTIQYQIAHQKKKPQHGTSSSPLSNYGGSYIS
jgi:hypothetical protein